MAQATFGLATDTVATVSCSTALHIAMQIAARAHSNACFRAPPGLEHLQCVETVLPAPPPGLENFPSPPPGLEIPQAHSPAACRSGSSMATSTCSTSASGDREEQEYKVLLENLP